MAYNVNNWGYVASGATIGVGFYWPGQDQGAQYAQGSPQNPGGDLISDGHEKSMDNTGQVFYGFTLTNRGLSTVFALEGGGLS